MTNKGGYDMESEITETANKTYSNRVQRQDKILIRLPQLTHNTISTVKYTI